MSKKIEVDTKTFIRFWLVILGLGLIALFLWKAQTGLLLVGISIFLAIAIRPLVKIVNNLNRKKKRPVLSAVVAYCIVVGVLGIALAVIGPVVVNETVKFVGQIPDTFEHTLGGWDGINDFGRNIGIANLQEEVLVVLQKFSNDFVSNFGSTVVTSVGTVANIVTTTILVLVLTLLFLLEGPGLLESFWGALEKDSSKKSRVVATRKMITRMTDVISTFVSKQVAVAILDGVITALAVFVLSLIFDFSAGLAFPMGLIAMVFCLIPMFGQVIGCVLITLILFFSSQIASVAFLVFYIVYAQIENNVIAPKIQGAALNLPIVIILSAITVGTYMLGLVGAIIAIPIAGCVKVWLEEYPKLKAIT